MVVGPVCQGCNCSREENHPALALIMYIVLSLCYDSGTSIIILSSDGVVNSSLPSGISFMAPQGLPGSVYGDIPQPFD